MFDDDDDDSFLLEASQIIDMVAARRIAQTGNETNEPKTACDKDEENLAEIFELLDDDDELFNEEKVSPEERNDNSTLQNVSKHAPVSLSKLHNMPPPLQESTNDIQQQRGHVLILEDNIRKLNLQLDAQKRENRRIWNSKAEEVNKLKLENDNFRKKVESENAILKHDLKEMEFELQKRRKSVAMDSSSIVANSSFSVYNQTSLKRSQQTLTDGTTNKRPRFTDSLDPAFFEPTLGHSKSEAKKLPHPEKSTVDFNQSLRCSNFALRMKRVRDRKSTDDYQKMYIILNTFISNLNTPNTTYKNFDMTNHILQLKGLIDLMAQYRVPIEGNSPSDCNLDYINISNKLMSLASRVGRSQNASRNSRYYQSLLYIWHGLIRRGLSSFNFDTLWSHLFKCRAIIQSHNSDENMKLCRELHEFLTLKMVLLLHLVYRQNMQDTVNFRDSNFPPSQFSPNFNQMCEIIIKQYQKPLHSKYFTDLESIINSLFNFKTIADFISKIYFMVSPRNADLKLTKYFVGLHLCLVTFVCHSVLKFSSLLNSNGINITSMILTSISVLNENVSVDVEMLDVEVKFGRALYKVMQLYPDTFRVEGQECSVVSDELYSVYCTLFHEFDKD